LLVKPQFELAAAGMLDPASHGVVQKSEDLLLCLDTLYSLWNECGLCPAGVYPAAIRGVSGNQEFFIRLQRSDMTLSVEQYHKLNDDAVSEAVA
jgi:predicted rRNA methylase YqxC with S4 and FtsJ domains